MRRPLWIHRPLVGWRPVCEWADAAGIRKVMPPEQLHLTLATVRRPVEWGDLELRNDILVVPAGPKPIRIYGWSVKGLSLDDPRISARHAELLARFPEMDHPRLRQHVSLYKGGRMPDSVYEGEIVLGPEVAEEFVESNAHGIKHVKVADLMAA